MTNCARAKAVSPAHDEAALLQVRIEVRANSNVNRDTARLFHIQGMRVGAPTARVPASDFKRRGVQRQKGQINPTGSERQGDYIKVKSEVCRAK